MRTLTRKLLSLLLVFTMVCAMVPAAMAADDGTGGSSEETPVDPSTCEHTYNGYKSDETTHWQVCTKCHATTARVPHDVSNWSNATDSTHTGTCTVCKETATESHRWDYTAEGQSAGTHLKFCWQCQESTEGTSEKCSDFRYEGNGNGTHRQECRNCGQTLEASIPCTNLRYTRLTENPGYHEKYCRDCHDTLAAQEPCTLKYENLGDRGHRASCTLCTYSKIVDHVYDENGKCVCGEPVEPVEKPDLNVKWHPSSDTKTIEVGYTQRFLAIAEVTVGGVPVQGVTPTYSWSGGTGDNTDSSYSLYAADTGTYHVSCTVTANYNGEELKASKDWTITVQQTALTLNNTTDTLNGRNDYVDLVPTVTAEGYDAKDVDWSVSKSGIVELDRDNDGSVRVLPLKNGTVDVIATLDVGDQSFEASCEITVKGVNTDISVGATVFNTNPGYALGDEDDDAKTSIVDQIRDEIDDITDGDEDLDYVRFYSPVSYKNEGELDVSTKESYYLDPGKNDEDISDVVFIPDEEYKGKVTFNFLAVDTDGYEYDGEIVFDVEEGTASAGDIIYPAKSGDDVEFDVNDFEDFWEDKYSKGSLDYVTFGSVSSSRGDLVDADGDKVSSRTKYYADPTSKQADLDGVTFEPGRNTKTTVTIDFTAHGTNNSKRDAELSGTVVILYTEKDPEAIVYSSTGKNITLDADDFLDNYKDTMGSSASNIQIQFLEVPSNGTLYYNYNERTEKGTELTSKNVANHTFSTSSRASKSIEDVTYVPDSRGRSDTVRFACYTSGGDLRYYGKVTFGQTVQNVTVNMTSTSSGVTFQASTFFNADDALLSANTISFGTPSSGTLYKNWNGTSGTRVTASDMFSYVASVTGNASISTVTYVPVAGYSGTVTIPFSAYGAAGGIVSGTVSIRVTATTPTTIFTDVPTTGSQAWAYPFINRLAAAGVVSGVTPTTYGPKQTVKWGEALKMVLLGAGHPAQVEGTGSNWASGYLTYAVNNGIVSNTNINLSSNITRLEMAELAAKALGMSPASRINTGIVGPTDTTNGYVYALYNAGIVGGDSSSGQNRYNGGSTLLRDEMAKIVCGVMDNA